MLNALRHSTFRALSEIMLWDMGRTCRKQSRIVACLYVMSQVLPEKLSELGGLTTNLNKSTYIKNKTIPILKLYEYSEMDRVDQLLAKFYKLDDGGRETVFKVLSIS